MALREIIARFGFQFDQGGLKKAQSGIAGVVSSLGKMGIALGAGVVARGIKNFVTGMVDAGDALGKTATQLGLSGKELQAWQTAANFAGVQTESLNQGFRILGKNALLAQQGSKQAADAFSTLGVEIEGANGQLKPANQLAREAGVALGTMEDRTKAVGLAQQVFGRAGAALLPLFAKGAEGLDEALAKLEEFGGGLSDELIPLAEAAQDRFTEFEIATTSLKSKLAVALMPALNQLTLALSKTLSWISKVGITAESFKSILVALGLVLGKMAIAKFGMSILKLGRAALLPLAKFLLLFLVVDDLIALFEGRGSVIGLFIDKIFGTGSAKSLIDGIKGVATAVSDFVGSGDLNKLDQDLEAVFGPPGQALVEGVVENFDAMALSIGEFIVETATAIDKWLVDSMASIRGSITDFAEAASDLGAAIVEGVVEGIVEGAADIVEALTGVVLGGVKSAKKAIKSSSPSRLTADEIGAPLVQGVSMGALGEAATAAKGTAKAFAVASSMPVASSISAPVRGGSGGRALGGVVFKSDIHIEVSGGSASDPSIQKLRQGVRSELRDNRRATLDALNQVIEAPA